MALLQFLLHDVGHCLIEVTVRLDLAAVATVEGRLALRGWVGVGVRNEVLLRPTKLARNRNTILNSVLLGGERKRSATIAGALSLLLGALGEDGTGRFEGVLRSGCGATSYGVASILS